MDLSNKLKDFSISWMKINVCMYKQGLKVHDFEMTKHLVGNLEHYYLLSSSNLHSFPGPKKSCKRTFTMPAERLY